MTFSNTQRVGEQYAAMHRPGQGRVFEPITLAEAHDIVTGLGDAHAIVTQVAAVGDWLAGLGDKVTDEAVFEDAENNGAVTCAVAILWAEGEYARRGRGCFQFISEMVERLQSRRGLYAGQIRGLLNCMRADVQRSARALAAVVADAKPFTDDDLDITPVAPEFAPVVAFLHRLAENGLKRPKVRIVTEAGDPVVLSIAGPGSKVPGGLAVTDGKPFGSNRFYGWVLPNGDANPPLKQQGEVLAALRALAADPEGALVRYGRVLGACAICGRTLVDPVSIARGIGPICAGKGGL